MTWENSGSKLNTRAKSQPLTQHSWLVTWKGGDYIVQRIVTQSIVSNSWKIRRRDNTHLLHILREKEGLGKEEAIEWIEQNC